jgi:hypothetical protein
MKPASGRDHIVHIAERAGLAAVAEHREIASEQGLHDEVGHNAAVVGMHARPVGIEDARDLDRELVLSPVVEEQCLGATLTLVVARARTNRIDVPPVILLLRMDQRVTVNLRCRGLQNSRPYAFGKTEHVDRAMHARLRGLNGVVLIVNGRGRTSEIKNLIYLDVERKGHIVPKQFETRMVEKMLDIPTRACEKIIEAQNHRAVGKQALA